MSKIIGVTVGTPLNPDNYGGGLPKATTEDNDKVLTVVNGEPQWALHAGISNKQKVVFADDGEGNVSIVLVEEEAPKDETVTITNIVTNPQFEDGMTGWTNEHPSSSVEVIDGDLCWHTFTGTAQRTYQRFTDQSKIVVGHKYYMSTRVQIEGSKPYNNRISLFGTNLTAEIDENPADTGDWSYATSVHLVTAAPGGKYVGYDALYYTDVVGSDSTVYIDNVVVIDLTAAFGEGNEPDRTTMDELMKKQYPNGFDGSVELVIREAESDVDELSKRVDAVEQQVASLATGSITQTGTVYPVLEPYYIGNIEEARPVYYNAQEAGALTFAMLSDIHLITSGSSQSSHADISKNVEASSAWAKLVNHDFVMLGGDLIVDYYDKPTALSLIDKVEEMAEKHARCPVYSVKGNHDTNEGTSVDIPEYRLTDKEFYLHANARAEKYGMVTDPAHPYGGYYYVDFTKQKIRMVCLNTSENNANYDILTSTKSQFRYIGVFSPNQMAWVKDIALRVDEGWAVMMVSHIPPFQAKNFYDRGTDNPALRELCEAFAAGTGDFAEQGAREFIGHFSGHAHIDAYNEVGGLNYILVNCTTPSKRWDTSLDRTADEDKLSLNSFIVDRATRTVKCIKIGASPSADNENWKTSFTW